MLHFCSSFVVPPWSVSTLLLPTRFTLFLVLVSLVLLPLALVYLPVPSHVFLISLFFLFFFTLPLLTPLDSTPLLLSSFSSPFILPLFSFSTFPNPFFPTPQSSSPPPPLPPTSCPFFVYLYCPLSLFPPLSTPFLLHEFLSLPFLPFQRFFPDQLLHPLFLFLLHLAPSFSPPTLLSLPFPSHPPPLRDSSLPPTSFLIYGFS